MILLEKSPNNGYFAKDGIDYPKNQYQIKYDNIELGEDRNFTLFNINDGRLLISSRKFSEITGVGDWAELVQLLTYLEILNSQDVAIQDQTSKTIILPMALEVASTTLATNGAIDSYSIAVVSATGLVIGQHVRIIDSINDRFFYGSILGIGGTIITLDTPLDFAYTETSQVIASITNMNVNGSVTPVTFVHRQGMPSTPTETDITRMIITCTADSAIDFSKFGNLPKLLRGIVFRKTNGIKENIFNLKSNADIASIMYDFTTYAATNPAQGLDGFVARLTFAGQSKLGVSLRIAQDENLELLVQDDLTDLTSLNIVLEGHRVEQ